MKPSKCKESKVKNQGKGHKMEIKRTKADKRKSLDWHKYMTSISVMLTALAPYFEMLITGF